MAERSQPRDVSARPSETRNEAGLHRIHADLGDDDRDRACRAHGRKGRRLTVSHDDIHWQTDELRREAGKLFCVAACVPIFDGEVLPLDIASVAQTLLKVPRTAIGAGRCAAVTEPTDSVWFRRRLRALDDVH